MKVPPALTRKIKGLPVYAWLLLFVVMFFVVRKIQKARAAAADAEFVEEGEATSDTYMPGPAGLPVNNQNGEIGAADLLGIAEGLAGLGSEISSGFGQLGSTLDLGFTEQSAALQMGLSQQSAEQAAAQTELVDIIEDIHYEQPVQVTPPKPDPNKPPPKKPPPKKPNEKDDKKGNGKKNDNGKKDDKKDPKKDEGKGNQDKGHGKGNAISYAISQAFSPPKENQKKEQLTGGGLGTTKGTERVDIPSILMPAASYAASVREAALKSESVFLPATRPAPVVAQPTPNSTSGVNGPGQVAVPKPASPPPSAAVRPTSLISKVMQVVTPPKPQPNAKGERP